MRSDTPPNLKKTLALWVLGTAAAFGLILEQVQAVRIGYAAGEAREKLRRQREVNATLKLELARLGSPERLSGAARDRLAMSPARPESIVFLPVSNRPAEPSGEEAPVLARALFD